MTPQTANAAGDGNIIIQVMGNNNSVGAAFLTLIPWRQRVTPAQQDTDILKPECEAVELVGRDSDRGFLQEWLSGGGIRVTAMIGRGGSGKTRLALDLLKHLPGEWDGGFLEPGEAQRFVEGKNLSTWGWQRPTLIVVDYAATIAPTLKEWLAALADHQAAKENSQPGLRLLLLERHANQESGWYYDLADSTRHGQRAHRLLQPSEPRDIAPIDSSKHRRAVLEAGHRVAARFANKPCLAVPEPGSDPQFDRQLANETWRDPLLLLMAAVLSVRDSSYRALKFARSELAIEMATRERDRLKRSIREDSARDLLVHMLGCATLCGGLGKKEALEAARIELEALGEEYPGGPGRLVKDLARWQGVMDRLDAGKPDLLAGSLLLVIFPQPDSLADVIGRLSQIAGARMVTVLVRLVQDYGYLSPEDALHEPRVKWAEQSLNGMKALVQAARNDVDVLFRLAQTLPESTLTLRAIALEVVLRLVSRLREQDITEEEGGQAILATWLVSLANRQGDMGQREAALRSIDEAVNIRRELARLNPEAFLPKLAMSLNNLSNQQSDMGQRKAALRSIDEAVKHYGELARLNPKAFLPDLAMSLNNLSNQQSDMGQRGAALRSIDEAVKHYGELARLNPEAFLPKLASSLNNLSIQQRAMGQREAALRSIDEAVKHSRELARLNPEAFLPDLAMSLNNLSLQQSAMGQREAAPFHRRSCQTLRRTGQAQPRSVPARSGFVAEQPFCPAKRYGAAGGGAPFHRRSCQTPPRTGQAQPRSVPAQAGDVAEQPFQPAKRYGAAGGGAPFHRRSCQTPPRTGQAQPRSVPARSGFVAEQPFYPAKGYGAAGGGAPFHRRSCQTQPRTGQAQPRSVPARSGDVAEQPF